MKTIGLNLGRSSSSGTPAMNQGTPRISAREKFLQDGKLPQPNARAQHIVNIFKTNSKKSDKTEDILREHGMLPPDDIDEMENVQLTNDYYNKIKYLEFSTFFFCWIGIGVSLVEYELRFNHTTAGTINESRKVQFTVLLWINLFCTISTCVSIVSRYILIVKWQIQKKLLLTLDNLITTKYYQSMILEIIAVLISPYPGLEYEYFTEVYTDRDAQVELNVNILLLSSALIIRLFVLIRFVLSFSRYRNSRMQRLCHINGTNANFMYALKCWKNDRPYSFIVASLFIPLIICGYCMRMFERPLIPISGFNFNNLVNCIWCIIITMATVGYGDYFPISNFGRIIGIMACLWGVFITAIMVVTLNNLLEFKRQESKSYEIMCKLAYKDVIRANAVSVILSAQRQKIERQKDDLDAQQLAIVFRDFRKNIFTLKQISKKVRGMYEDYNEVELVTKDVEEINQEVSLLMEIQQEILKEFKEFKKNVGGSSKTSQKSQKSNHEKILNSKDYENSILDEDSNSLTELEKQELFVNEDLPKDED
eukprot:403370921